MIVLLCTEDNISIILCVKKNLIYKKENWDELDEPLSVTKSTSLKGSALILATKRLAGVTARVIWGIYHM